MSHVQLAKADLQKLASTSNETVQTLMNMRKLIDEKTDNKLFRLFHEMLISELLRANMLHKTLFELESQKNDDFTMKCWLPEKMKTIGILSNSAKDAAEDFEKRFDRFSQQ